MKADREKIARLHGAGFNCAQVVAAMCAELSGAEEKQALSAMGGFGGGVRCGEICGAVSGGVYSLGLRYPYTDGTDLQTKNAIAELTKAFTARFHERFGALTCRALLDSAGGHARCEEFMAGAVELIYEILEGEENT